RISDEALFLLVGLQEAGELLLEARHTAAAVDKLLLPAGPGRMRLGVDVEVQGVTLLAPGGAGAEFTAVGHDHLDGVVGRMRILLHVLCSGRARRADWAEFGGSIQQLDGGGKPRAIDRNQAHKALRMRKKGR